MPSSRLSDADPRLAEAYTLARLGYIAQFPGRNVIVTCTYRSPEEQQILYAQGRTTPGQIVTQVDGVTKLSNHNHKPSRALDFAILVSGKISWNEQFYEAMGELAVAHGVAWGGHWRTFKDYPHLEIKGSD